MIVRVLTFWPPVILGIAFLVWGVVLPVQRYFDETNARQSTLENEIASLANRVERLSDIPARGHLDPNHYWDTEPGPLTTAEMQSLVYDLAETNGVPLAYISHDGADQMGAYRRYDFTLELEAKLSDLVAFLGALEEANPPFGVSRLQIRPIPRFDEDAEGTLVFVNLTVWALGRMGGS